MKWMSRRSDFVILQSQNDADHLKISAFFFLWNAQFDRSQTQWSSWLQSVCESQRRFFCPCRIDFAWQRKICRRKVFFKLIAVSSLAFSVSFLCADIDLFLRSNQNETDGKMKIVFGCGRCDSLFFWKLFRFLLSFLLFLRHSSIFPFAFPLICTL